MKNSSNIETFIASITKIDSQQIKVVLDLLENGATVPFIARYRKDQTGNLTDIQIDEIQKQQERFEQIVLRKKAILKSILEQQKLTPELEHKINECFDLSKLEDIYLPFKPKKQNKAELALKAGLGGLASRIMKQEYGDIETWALQNIRKDYPDAQSVLKAVNDILVSWIAENETVREKLRKSFIDFGVLECKEVKSEDEEAKKYQDFFSFSQLISKCPSYRLLAIFRGEQAGYLKVKIEPNPEYTLSWLDRFFVKQSNEAGDFVKKALVSSYKKSLQLALENETRQFYKEKADEQSIATFSQNLEKLLLAAPVGNHVTLAIDPGFKSGCKVVVLNEAGKLVHNETIYPHPPQQDSSKAAAKVNQLVQSYKVEVIAIGDGTAGRETENFIRKIRFDRDLRVFVVREDGASIYSASKAAREEFPTYDVTVRGAVSIGRRLMDPLAELVKIEPKSLGVGQYQHDVNQTKLADELDRVVIRSVNRVGVDVNTASKYLLSYVAGLGPKLAENIVTYREKNGLFKNRQQLLKVERMGDKAFQQCAGFLRIKNGDNPLDNSAVHPENYSLVKSLAQKAGLTINDLVGNKEAIKQIASASKASDNTYTLSDILNELEKPGIDPRRVAKVFEFAKNIRSIEDLKIGMELPGIVTNVTDFGAFVNIGIKENGLIHRSQLNLSADQQPTAVINLHDQVEVEVLSIDTERKRIGLKRASKK